MKPTKLVAGVVFFLFAIVSPSASIAAAKYSTALEIAADTCGPQAERVVGKAVGACQSAAVLFQLAIVKSEGKDLLTGELTSKHQRTRLLNVGSCFFPLGQANEGAGGVEYVGYASRMAFVRPVAPAGTLWNISVSMPAGRDGPSTRAKLRVLLADFDRRMKEGGLAAADVAGISFCQRLSA